MIKEFSVGCSRTINLGNFESVRVEASVTMNVTGSEADSSKCIDDLKKYAQAQLRGLLEETYKNQYVDRKKIA